MTNLQSIKSQLRQIYRHRPGRVILVYGDEPAPQHVLPGDCVVRLEEGDQDL